MKNLSFSSNKPYFNKPIIINQECISFKTYTLMNAIGNNKRIKVNNDAELNTKTNTYNRSNIS